MQRPWFRFHAACESGAGECPPVPQMQSLPLFSALRFQKLLWQSHFSKQAHFFWNISPSPPPHHSDLTSYMPGYFLLGSLAWQNPWWFRGTSPGCERQPGFGAGHSGGGRAVGSSLPSSVPRQACDMWGGQPGSCEGLSAACRSICWKTCCVISGAFQGQKWVKKPQMEESPNHFQVGGQ